MQTASDADKKIVTRDGDIVSISYHPDEVNYTWELVEDATGAVVWQSGPSSAAASSFVMPQEPGTYTLSCTINDRPIAIPAGQGISRDDLNTKVSSARLAATTVKFVQDPNEKYGFDEFGHGPRLYPAWKSVAVGLPDTVFAEITPRASTPGIYFTETPPGFVTLDPKQGTTVTGPQKLTITGGAAVANGDVYARRGKPTGFIADQLKVAVYNKMQRRVAVVIVNEINGGFTVSDIPHADIQAALKQVFKQAVVEWTEIRRFPPEPVRFDLNNNGKLDVGLHYNALNTRTNEANAIIGAMPTEIK